MVDYVKASKRAKSMGIDISPSVLKEILSTPPSKLYKQGMALERLKSRMRKIGNPSKKAKGGSVTKKKK